MQQSRGFNCSWDTCAAGCRVEGRLLREGETASISSDNCVQCRCVLNTLVCSKQACPVLSCPASRRRKMPSECCPTCTGESSSCIKLILCMRLTRSLPYSWVSIYVKNNCLLILVFIANEELCRKLLYYRRGSRLQYTVLHSNTLPNISPQGS